jgi:hypothetical protein
MLLIWLGLFKNQNRRLIRSIRYKSNYDAIESKRFYDWAFYFVSICMGSLQNTEVIFLILLSTF